MFFCRQRSSGDAAKTTRMGKVVSCSTHNKKKEKEEVERIKKKPGGVGVKRGAGGRSFDLSDRSLHTLPFPSLPAIRKAIDHDTTGGGWGVSKFSAFWVC